MLARRIVAVAPDKAFGKRLSVALMAAGGSVDWHATAEELGKGELGAALLVVHMADANDLAGITALVGRLAGESKAIVILPAVSLPAVVELMQGSDKVAGLLVAEDLDLRSLSAMATRVMAGDLFGLDKLVRWGTQIHNHLVGDYQEKSLCISQTSEFAEAIGVRRKYREAIEQCMDEMLMNALYDAPVDEHGKQIFSEIPTKTRISLRVEQKVVVQYACDGTRFYLSVRDAFGTLERATVLRYLHKCLYSEQQIDRKAGGAGLGLYLMVNASSEVYFNVLPGVATEAVCVFDLETPKLQLDCIGFFYERIDAAGRLAGGPSRRLPAGVGFPVERRAPRGPAPAPVAAPTIGKPVIALLVAMIVVVGGLIAAVAVPRLRGTAAAKKTTVEVHTDPPGATIELDGKSAGVATGGKFTITDVEVGHTYPIVARLDGYEVKTAVIQPVEDGSEISMHLVAQAPTVRLETMPSGAAVSIDGKDTGGVTPLVVTTLVPGATVKLGFKKAGFHDAEVALDVPGPGKETRLVQPLAVADDVARVKIISEPPGAQITQNGQLVAGVVTPADLLVEAGKPVRFTLSMAKKVPVTLEPFTPLPGADGIVKSVTFVDGVTLTVTVAGIDNAKLTIGGQPQCGHAVPLECLVAPGKYTIALEASGGVRVAHRGVVVGAGAATAADKFELGTVTAPAGKKLQGPAGTPVGKLVLEAGPRKVTVIDEDGTTTHVATVTVAAGASVVAN